MAKKPELHLLGSSDGPTALPALDDILKMFTKLSGRQPTEAEIADARAILDKNDAQK